MKKLILLFLALAQFTALAAQIEVIKANGTKTAVTPSVGWTIDDTGAATVSGVQSLTRLSNLTGNGFLKTSGANGTLVVDPTAYATAAQGVSSLSLSTPNVLYATPITFANTGSNAWAGALTLNSQAQNLFLASPNGVAGTPSMRPIAAADVPTLNQNSTGSAAKLTTGSTINGVNFDGSGPITITAAAGTLSGSALPAGVTSAPGLAFAPAAQGVASLALATPNVLYSTPINFTNTAGAWAGSLTLNSQAQNLFLASPNGAAGTPSMRAIVAADVPALPYAPAAQGVASLNLNTPNVLFSTPIVFTNGGANAWSGALTLNGQAANSVFGNFGAAGTAPAFSTAPTFAGTNITGTGANFTAGSVTNTTAGAGKDTLSVTFAGAFQSALILPIEPPSVVIPAGTAAGTVTAGPNAGGKWITGLAYAESSAAYGPRLTALTFNDLTGASGTVQPNACLALTSLSFPTLAYVGGGFSPQTLPVLTTLNTPALVSVGGACSPITMALLTTLSFPALTSVGSNYSPTTMAALTTMTQPVLATVGGSCSPTTMALLGSLTYPALTSVGGNCSASTMASLTSLSYPVLATVGGIFGPGTMALLTNLSVPSLTTVGTLSPGVMGSLTTMSFPALVAVTNSISVSSAAVLSTLSFPSIVTVGTTITCSTLPALSTVTINPSLLAVNGATVTFAGDALNVASTDLILSRFAALDGTAGTTLFGAGKTLTLTGGSNAPPTFTGTSFATTAIVVSGGVATVTRVAHGLSTGSLLNMSGASGGGTSAALNGQFSATFVDVNTFTYPTASSNGTVVAQGTVKWTATTTEGYYKFLKLGVRGVAVTTN